jgi:hypothetical protein
VDRFSPDRSEIDWMSSPIQLIERGRDKWQISRAERSGGEVFSNPPPRFLAALYLGETRTPSRRCKFRMSIRTRAHPA